MQHFTIIYQRMHFLDLLKTRETPLVFFYCEYIGPDHVQQVNCRKKFGLAWPKVNRPAHIFSYNLFSVYNSLSAAIHLYMIRPLEQAGVGMR